MSEQKSFVQRLRIVDDSGHSLTGKEVLDQGMCSQSVEKGLMALIDIVNHNADILLKVISNLGIDINTGDEN